ncbi:MAG: hypothetical protein D6705_15760 [Deltaproteobacteria bacterium]|nr:MAG: hypothetical protein D6705_15760 [Deltaproteobacteria bacterium]
MEGTRNVSMGNGAIASTYGTNAAIANPAAMSFAQQFSIEPMYQLEIRSLRNGVGAVVMDSLNNARVALALGYLFMRGAPKIYFDDSSGERKSLTLSHFGHEAFAAVSVAVVKQWLSVAIKPKYQYTSLRYRDEEGTAHNAHDKLNFFGLDMAVGVNFAGWAALHVVGNNLVGSHGPAYTCDPTKVGCTASQRELSLDGIDADPATIDHNTVSRLSDYPLLLGHGLAVFPLHNPNFSINFDGTYDFTSYRESDKKVRMTYGGSAEFIAGPVPIRAGSYWDSMGPGKADDRVYVTGGLGYVKPAKLGGVGVDVGIGVRQQVAGFGPKETFLAFHVGLRIRPDL